jgi:hypothetical protein
MSDKGKIGFLKIRHFRFFFGFRLKTGAAVRQGRTAASMISPLLPAQRN